MLNSTSYMASIWRQSQGNIWANICSFRKVYRHATDMDCRSKISSSPYTPGCHGFPLHYPHGNFSGCNTKVNIPVAYCGKIGRTVFVARQRVNPVLESSVSGYNEDIPQSVYSDLETVRKLNFRIGRSRNCFSG